ncbi:MAG TPA: leucine-rich repeat domain-containing protein [Oscillospiraceae bacterium]|nr:leucine-rich repeat domain-containing protein [Oscillospiraceae bacterium]
MTVNDFLRRWLLHYVNPDLFKLPVNGLGEPLIVDIVITDGAVNQSVAYLNYCNTYVSQGCVQLRSRWVINDSEVVTQENYPQYFNDTGKHITTPATAYSSYYNMTPDLYMNLDEGIIGYVDWGDGSALEPIAFTYTAPPPTARLTGLWDGINDSSKISAKEYRMTFSSGRMHTYTASGRYRVKIYGRKIPQVTISRNKPYFDVAQVVQWGELDYKSTERMFNNYVFDVDSLLESLPASGWEVFKNVKSTCDMFYGVYTVSWDMMPKDIMKYFPAVIDASYMFYHTRCNEIPEYFTINNPDLMYINGIFSGAQVESIGDYAFANLSNLVSAEYVINSRGSVYFSGIKSDTLRRIGNSVFENCINLESDAPYILYVHGNANDYHGLDTVGSYVFKNCKKIKNSNGWGGMFYGNWYLKSIGDGVLEGCESIETMYDFCYCCFSLVSVGNDIFKGCISLTSIRFGFYRDYNLLSVGTGIFSGCINLRDAAQLFYYAYRLPTIPADLFAGLSKLYDVSAFLGSCISLSSVPAGLLKDIVYDGTNKIDIEDFAYLWFDENADGSLQLSYDRYNNPVEVELAGTFYQSDVAVTDVGDIFNGNIGGFSGVINISSAFFRSTGYKYTAESDDTHIVYENYYRGKTSGNIPDWWNQISEFSGSNMGCFGYIATDYSKTEVETGKTVTNNYHITNPAAVSVPSEFTPTSHVDNQTWLYYMGL